jgi:hypothetical protein
MIAAEVAVMLVRLEKNFLRNVERVGFIRQQPQRG